MNILINITECAELTGYWFETIFIIRLEKKNIAFAKLFGTFFGSNIIALFTECQCQDTDTFGFVQAQTFTFKILI